MELEIGTKVTLPFGETGTIKRITRNQIDWFKCKVRIRKAIFNKTNQVIAFKKEQITIE